MRLARVCDIYERKADQTSDSMLHDAGRALPTDAVEEEPRIVPGLLRL